MKCKECHLPMIKFNSEYCYYCGWGYEKGKWWKITGQQEVIYP